jgi:hypothetical protein
MSYKRSLLIIGYFLFCLGLYAQVEEQVQSAPEGEKARKTFSQRLFFGGDVGLSFGSITYIKLAPEINYNFTDRFSAGLGPIYIYEKYKNVGFESSTYGGKVVSTFVVFKSRESGGSLGIGDIVLHGENEVLSVERIYIDLSTYPYSYFTDSRIWIDNLLLGGGLVQTISGRFKVAIYVLWDVTQNDFSPYSNPIFKFGVYF